MLLLLIAGYFLIQPFSIQLHSRIHIRSSAALSLQNLLPHLLLRILIRYYANYHPWRRGWSSYSPVPPAVTHIAHTDPVISELGLPRQLARARAVAGPSQLCDPYVLHRAGTVLLVRDLSQPHWPVVAYIGLRIARVCSVGAAKSGGLIGVLYTDGEPHVYATRFG